MIDGGTVRISNGRIEGFLYGIRIENDLEADTAAYVDRVEVDGGARGIFAQAKRVVIRNTFVHSVNGYDKWPAAHTIGIEVNAKDCVIEDNVVKEVFPFSMTEAIGISVSRLPDRCAITDNYLANSYTPRVGRSLGFWVSGPNIDFARIAFDDNIVTGFNYAFLNGAGNGATFAGNRFTVDCLPEQTFAYGTATARNRFRDTGASCEDNPVALKQKSLSGNPEWGVRLAQSYLERLDRVRTDRERCTDLMEAALVLAPFNTMIQAQEQKKRIEAGLAVCAAEGLN